ncbi:MAG: hypothetical protein NZT92_21585 [Abditibacteriales bacterium]|nr:hypothetical protein [Abditibacteriales bacterium]MDW8365405.1 LptA/OstA family protein [Abditibacteriales bacterium]
MTRRRFALIPFVVLTLTVTGSAFRVHPQGASKPKGKAAPKQEPSKEYKDFVLKHADQVIGAPERLTLIGHVEIAIPEDDLLLFADRVELDSKEKVAQATGNVRLRRGEEMSLNSETLRVDINENRATCSNNVRLIYRSRPKSPQTPNSAASKGNEGSKTTTLTCDLLDYDLDKKTATATGKLHVDYDNGSATAEKAIFLEEDKLVTLEGRVSISVKGESKVTLTMEKVTVNLETGTLHGDKPQGKISVPRGERAPNPKPPAAPEENS